jgi:urate oxidase
MIETFAAHDSKSVQQTLYAMGTAALKAQPVISEIRLSLPNKHCLPVDLTPFGLKNENEIFMPVDEPHGLIEGTIVVRPE